MIRLLRNARVPSIAASFGHDTIRRSPGFAGGFSRGMAHGIQWLNSFVNYEQIGVPKNAGGDSDLGFPMDRMRLLLESLGSPEKALGKVVQVVGTKGKGSTVAFLENILKHSGYNVGSYTSPHIHSLYERIRVNGKPIEEDDFDSLVEESKSSIDSCQKELGLKGSVSHFEVLTALAFKYFEQSGIDIAVIEAGLGGVRDATNVFKPSQVLATVVVPIGMDHAAALGGTIESIAAAKAGIIKHKAPVIVARQNSLSAEAIVLHEASIKESVSTKVASSVMHQIEGHEYPSQGQSNDTLKQNVLFHISRDLADGLEKTDGNQDVEIEASLHLVGAHQAENAATALTSAISMATHGGLERITLDSIKDGLAATKLEGRFEIIGHELDTNGLPLYTIVDGAHNEDSALCLSKTARSCFPDAKIALVLAMASDKDHYGFCREIQKMEPSIVVFTDVAIAGTSNRSAAPGVLAGAWQAAKMNQARKGWRCRELIQASMKAAISKARHELSGPAEEEYSAKVVLISGSLHAIGAARDR